MLYYINNKAETDNILRKHADGKMWIHSGDLGYISENGFVHISGRLKRYMLCIKNGVQKKVFSLDIEKVLLECQEIENCAVVPVDDPKINQIPVAFIILKKEFREGYNKQMLKDFCERNLEEVYCPIEYYFVTNFPLTKVGKVDYRALEKEAAKLKV